MDLLAAMTTLSLAILGGAITWIAAYFVGQPLLKFRDLRSEVSARLAEFDNILPTVEQERLGQAQSTFRRLGTEINALTETRRLAVWALERVGYDPAMASRGLIGLSNSLTGPLAVRGKDLQKAAIRRALLLSG
jgi:hypothetical protein